MALYPLTRGGASNGEPLARRTCACGVAPTTTYSYHVFDVAWLGNVHRSARHRVRRLFGQRRISVFRPW